MIIWSKHEIEILRECAALHGSYSDAAAVLGRSRAAVAGKAQRLGIKFDFGKAAYGSRHPKAKLHESDIPRIRRMIKDSIPLRQIALEYGVSDVLIGDIRRGNSWAHVPERISGEEINEPG